MPTRELRQESIVRSGRYKYVCSRKHISEGCKRVPFFAVTGTNTAGYCAPYAPDRMVNVNSRKCGTEDCGKMPWFEMANTRAAEYCAQHASGIGGCKRREIGQRHFREGTIGNVIPVTINITPFILLTRRQAFHREVAGGRVSECDTQILRLQLQSKLSYKSRLEDRGLRWISTSKNVPSSEILP